MEGFWGMGSTVSSYSTAKRLEVGAPGGGQGGRKKKGQDTEQELRRALADRIEDNLNGLLTRARQILRENRQQVLALAHALETHKTLSGDDVVAVIERQQGPIVDGRPYADPDFIQELEDYHNQASAAHRQHAKMLLSMPELAQPVLIAVEPAGVLVAGQNAPGPDHGNGGPVSQDGLAEAPGLADGLGSPAPEQGNGSAPHAVFSPAAPSAPDVQPETAAEPEPAGEPSPNGQSGSASASQTEPAGEPGPSGQPEPGSNS
jgi:hypothetical protein